MPLARGSNLTLDVAQPHGDAPSPGSCAHATGCCPLLPQRSRGGPGWEKAARQGTRCRQRGREHGVGGAAWQRDGSGGGAPRPDECGGRGDWAEWLVRAVVREEIGAGCAAVRGRGGGGVRHKFRCGFTTVWRTGRVLSFSE
ncbi:unnamed protein product [Miscanthus lutarioriparius]|uniref:Uncharacterized protein n=1 Tax=Miscanthus lutarioriparius TaxID=422564 RepID=A0A811MBL0_9POAL|nr:unnamed protein product [Miscanthus lutarioriparius]